MLYFSLNKQSPKVDFKEATILGQAPDKGLYFPESLPIVDSEMLAQIESLPNNEIAFKVIQPYVGNTIPEATLFDIVSETVHFPIPLVALNQHIQSLELFHGPTLAFKDIGARFMSRCLSYFLKDESKKVTVLVATSGDTGGAVANGFHNVEGINVIILYPKGGVSPVQEKQLTTLGSNITALEIEGNFDDCQAMVKQAFMDTDIRSKLMLTSANSINVARWLPQQFYYFFAWKQWANKELKPIISVPSGNFGNICAGLLAKITGLPLGHFIAACNINDIVSPYLHTEKWVPQVSKPTLSNAMDVGNPSNFVRIMQLFGNKFPTIKNELSSYTVNDEQTFQTIVDVYKKEGYTLDPHGAVAYFALEKYLYNHSNGSGIILETAHPVKFPSAVQKAIKKELIIPKALEEMMRQVKNSIEMKPDFALFKDWLLSAKPIK